ncbi:hypothetical protein RJ640_012024 [Escallonia rubra]|uniref:SET domain-containing protein n=1 Tax=Escallonia rubra TaxID=112253 RepID=A0AA88S3A4_9ASTE|nr:hypothetical protein RJ640_012024 [Escallonia rubra]
MGKRHQSSSSNEQESPLVQCAGLILPWLQPIELSSISSTCKALNDIARAITVTRISDASHLSESFAIPFINTVDDTPYAYFLYTPIQTLALQDPLQARQHWGSEPSARPGFEPGPAVEGACGCECPERCGGGGWGFLGCPCWGRVDSGEVTRECGPSCACGSGCGNRVTLKGVSVKLKVVRDRRKGWGLHADDFIPYGQFVCEYAGELLTTKEARRRQQAYDELALGGRFSSALLVVREHLPSGNICIRINIDATRIGNVARFINHSCDGGNLSTVLRGTLLATYGTFPHELKNFMLSGW